MKNKFLILFIGIISFLGISEAKAETYTITKPYIIGSDVSVERAKNLYVDNSETIKTMFDELLSHYEENYKNNYPYYFVFLNIHFNNEFDIDFVAYSDIPQISRIPVYDGDSRYDFRPTDSSFNRNPNAIFLRYSYDDGAIVKPIVEVLDDSAYANNTLLSFVSYLNDSYDMTRYYYSNFDLKYISEDSSDKIVISNYPFDNGTLTINNGDSFPRLQDLLQLDIMKDSSLPSSNYTEINLNNYPYVALALKDYSNTNEFVTTMYVKGQYCLSPVYNYGMTERKDILSGTTIQRCSLVYDNFTPIRTYILENDIKNNAIYYLKAYDTTHDNIVRVDSSIFDITYITEETKDNPYIMVGGKSYPAIAYDDLTDSATISEENNYASGGSCALGDMNCVSTITGQSFTFSDIFTSPLEILKDVWSAIVKVFELITMLISLLPPVLQAFLYMSFMLAIILGLIKILL